MGIDTHSPANQSHLTAMAAGPCKTAARVACRLMFMGAVVMGCASCHCGEPDHSAAELTVPGTGMVVGRDWGTLPPVTVHNAHQWQPIHAVFLDTAVRHNPVYMKDLDHNAKFSGNASTFCVTSRQELIGLADIPWFYINLAVCPIMMLERPPFVMETSAAADYRPIYNGQISAKTDWPARSHLIVSARKLNTNTGKNGENVKN